MGGELITAGNRTPECWTTSGSREQIPLSSAQVTPPTSEITNQSVVTHFAELECVGTLQPSALNHR